MNLTEAERLVRRIESYLKQPDEMLQPATMAETYASEHQAAIKRVVTCQRIIRDGDHDQGLRLAMEPPAVLELINCLEFRNARDWVALCKDNGWSAPRAMDREAVRTLQQAYTEGGKADHDFVRRYRGAVMARDWPNAYDALQSILKVQPNDAGYLKEAERLRKQILEGLLAPLGQAVEAGDVQEVIRLSSEVESLPFKPTFTGDTWPNAQIMRCGKLLADAENRQNAEDWRPVLSLTESVKELTAQYGLSLPADLAQQLARLREWAVAEALEHDQQEKHGALVSELRHLLQKSEESQMTSINPDLATRKMELDTLARNWREIEGSGRGIPEELQDQYERNTMLLRGQVGRRQRTRRTVWVAAAVLTLAVAGVAGFLFLEARSANSQAAGLAALIEARKVQAAESLAESIRKQHPRLASFAKVKAVLEQGDLFCKEERDAEKELDAKIAGVARWAADGFKQPSPKEIQQEMDACKAGLNSLAEEFKPDAERALASVQNEWERHRFGLEDERNMRFSGELGPAEDTVQSLLEFDLSPASASNKLEVLLRSVERMQKLIPYELELKIRGEYIERFGVLTNRVAGFGRELDTWEKGRATMWEAADLEGYMKGVERIRGSKVVTEEQEKAFRLLSRLLDAKVARDQLMKALLMPGRDKAWKRFTENQALQVSPSNLMPSEATQLNTLLTNPHINGMKMGRVRDIKYDKNFQKMKGPWRSVYMFEALERMSQSKGELTWANLYDPVKHTAKLAKEYYNIHYTTLEFEFITEHDSGMPASLPESKLLNRLGLSELVAGKPVSLAGMLDEIHNDTEASPVFKKYIIEILMNVIDLRPGEWDTYWLTHLSLRDYRDRLGKINCCKNSGDWMVPDIQKNNAPKYWAEKTKAPPAKPSMLENFFMLHHKASLGESARLSHQIVLRPYDVGFTLVGFVELDHAEDEKLSLRKPTTKRLWGWDTNGKPTKLYEWNPEKGHEKAVGTSPMPFGPLFVFNGDAAAIKVPLLKDNKTGHSNEELEPWFPPLYQ